MSDQTHIEWTDTTWNILSGCTRVSAGCDHCYIERTPPFRMAHRKFDGTGPGSTTGVQLHPARLDQPLHWRKPRKVFVNSLADLFHDEVTDEYIAKVFAVMALARRHTFQVLTKRPARMRSLLSRESFPELVTTWAWRLGAGRARALPRGGSNYSPSAVAWPLPNVWLGVSVESQQWADIRIPALLDTPAAVRFLSCEPLLGPVKLAPEWLVPKANLCSYSGTTAKDHAMLAEILRAATRKFAAEHGEQPLAFVDWVICGGESGPGARPMHPDWARSLRDQCVSAGVPFLFKQWGAWSPNACNALVSKHRWQYESMRFRPTGECYTAADVGNPETGYSAPGMESLLRVGKKSAGRELDGRTWDEYPVGAS
jgi:protein gp37